jgi:uncharacterized membrane protein YfcA
VAVPVGIAGALTATYVHDSVLLACYSLLVAVLAVVMWRNKPPADSDKFGLEGPPKAIVDSRGHEYRYAEPQLGWRSYSLTGIGAFLTGMVSVGIGEVTISKLTRKGLPIAVAAATSVLVVIVTVALASTTLAVQLIRDGGWTAVPWDLLVYDIPGVLIGGQIGPRLQGKIAPHTMRRAIALLFVILATAMMAVAWKKTGL